MHPKKSEILHPASICISMQVLCCGLSTIGKLPSGTVSSAHYSSPAVGEKGTTCKCTSTFANVWNICSMSRKLWCFQLLQSPPNRAPSSAVLC